MRRLSLPLLVVVIALSACADRSSAGAPPSGSTPDVLEVNCDGSSTTAGEAVQAQADGVHVRITNTSDAELLVGWESGGDGAKPGESSFVFPILPGDGKIRCQRQQEDPGAPGGWAMFNVLATPDWVSPLLECPNGMSQGNLDYAAGSKGVKDPLADARSHAEGLDVLQAGYATDDNVAFVGFDDGVPTHSFGYVSDGADGWLLTETGACS